MGKYWWSADWHYNHWTSYTRNIIKYCNRPYPTIEDMNKDLINNFSGMVDRKNDTLHFLGDLSFDQQYFEHIAFDIFPHKTIFIRGNHDRIPQRVLKSFPVYDLKTVNIQGNIIVMCHFCLRVWDRSHYNSWHLYAHCLDLKTEVLTSEGWKTRDRINEKDQIVTLNLNNNCLEYNKINKIIDVDYSGDVYKIKTKTIDLRLTENHVLIDCLRGNKNRKYRKFLAKNLTNLSRRTFVVSGHLDSKMSINLSENHLRLLIWMTADGNLCNSNLMRIRIFKERKIKTIRNLLIDLKINFRELPQKDGSISFNFSIPEVFTNFRIKPLDTIIQHCNNNQLDIILDEYSKTDGYKNGNSILIYTSKKEESDIIQAACIKNGHMCNISERKDQGFSKNINYEITVTKKDIRSSVNLNKLINISKVTNEHFWCLKVDNQTLFIRRNGKPVIVGNSHSTLSPIGKSWDVGVDNNNFKPVSLEQIAEIMKNQPDNPNYLGNKGR